MREPATVRYSGAMPEKLTPLTIRLSRTDHAALVRLAAAKDVHMAAYVRGIIQRHVAAKARREAP